MELWVIDGNAPPRQVEIDLELGGDQFRDVEGRAVRPTTHFGTLAGALSEQAKQQQAERSHLGRLRPEWSVLLLEPDLRLHTRLASTLGEYGFEVASVASEREAMAYLLGPTPPACAVLDRMALSSPGPELAADLARRRFGQTWLVLIDSTPEPGGGVRLRESLEQIASAVHLACSRHEVSHSAQPSQ